MVTIFELKETLDENIQKIQFLIDSGTSDFEGKINSALDSFEDYLKGTLSPEVVKNLRRRLKSPEEIIKRYGKFKECDQKKKSISLSAQEQLLKVYVNIYDALHSKYLIGPHGPKGMGDWKSVSVPIENIVSQETIQRFQKLVPCFPSDGGHFLKLYSSFSSLESFNLDEIARLESKNADLTYEIISKELENRFDSMFNGAYWGAGYDVRPCQLIGGRWVFVGKDYCIDEKDRRWNHDKKELVEEGGFKPISHDVNTKELPDEIQNGSNDVCLIKTPGELFHEFKDGLWYCMDLSLRVGGILITDQEIPEQYSNYRQINNIGSIEGLDSISLIHLAPVDFKVLTEVRLYIKEKG